MVKDFAIAGGQKAHGPEMITEIILHGPTPLPKELKSLDSKGRFSPINILNLLTEWSFYQKFHYFSIISTK